MPSEIGMLSETAEGEVRVMQFPSKVNVVAVSIISTLTALFCVAGNTFGDEPKIPEKRGFSWQEPHAKVLLNGGLQWAPKPFVFEKGGSLRYIDFESGNDSHDGKTPQTAWKSHPWDSRAKGLARACKGIHTYVFKGGVVYRGTLTATDSGSPGNPIRLTRDPAWGQGTPIFNGSFQLKGGWKKATADDAPGFPNPQTVWFKDIGKKKASSMWQVSGDKIERLHVARWPDFDSSDPDDPVKNWPVFSAYDFNTGQFISPNLKKLGDKSFFDGATLWSEGAFLMASACVCSYQNGSYDPQAGSIIIDGRAGNELFKRIPNWAKIHFLFENSPKFLDAPGEFYYAAKPPRTGRLYLRPAGDIDPNKVHFELAQTGSFVNIANLHDIVISGLDFRHNDPDFPNNYGSPCISILGNSANITVKNCQFSYVSGAVSASIYKTGGGEQLVDPPGHVLDNIIICDNDIRHVEKSGAIYVNGTNQIHQGATYGQLKHVEVLRNRLFDTGFRHGTAPWGSLPAIAVNWAETCEIAGNIVDRSFGNGIITFGGKSSGAFNVVPLTRILVHHNQLDNTMLNCNDYGGLEHFQGGPVYTYNNVVRNSVGNSVCNKAELAYGIYLDGGFKCYVFNNIIAGKVKPGQPDYYNYAGYFMVAGFMDQFFNNTIYHVRSGLLGNSGNRCNILGNVLVDNSETFIGQNQPGDVSMLGGGDTGATGRSGIPTMSYAHNLFFGSPKKFGAVAGISKTGSYSGAPIVPGKNVDDLRKNLEAENCRLATVGSQVNTSPLTDPASKDYRPTTSAEGMEQGVKYFVPWSLARTVGEWNFYKSATNPQTVLGEEFYMTDEYFHRDMYYFLPRRDLNVSACAAKDYSSGPLEDWIEGALNFDGKNRVATLSHAEMTRSMKYPGNQAYNGSRRETVDMQANNFLIEVTFKTAVPHLNGVLAGKMAQSGYELVVDPDGSARLNLQAANNKASFSSRVKINDGQWHHVIAEVDRKAGEVRFFIDGKDAGDGKLDTLSENAMLSNTADFVVGKGFSGAIDFLRITRSTLADSQTTIDELYAWEFDGPFLRDFTGRRPQSGQPRDAGAISR
jgi:hypothetical protein